MIGEVFRLIRVPFIAFIGGFLVVGGWMWAPKISNLIQSQFSGGPSVSLFADTNRIGRPETAPVVRSCIFKVVDVGPDAAKMQPSAAYFILKAGTMQANVSGMLGKSDRWSENQAANLATSWGQLADCIYAQDDRELCDPDNRAAAVEATTKFFAFARQTDGTTGKPAMSASDASVLEGVGDRLLIMLKNHRRYGTLVAADFGSFAPAAIMRIMREERPATSASVDVRAGALRSSQIAAAETVQSVQSPVTGPCVIYREMASRRAPHCWPCQNVRPPKACRHI